MSTALQHFVALKADLLDYYRRVHPSFQGQHWGDFRLSDIHRFQALLEQEQGARLSEKWVYTHLKPASNSKLPHIDTLNLLARLLGYGGWDDYCHQRQLVLPGTKRWSRRKLLGLVVVCLPVITMLLAWLLPPASLRSQALCLVDTFQQTAVVQSEVYVSITEGQQPVRHLTTDSTGCVLLPYWEGEATLIIAARYYHSDTLRCTFAQLQANPVYALQPDDYALMIHYFANSEIEQWKERRAYLQTVIANEVVVYQMDPEGQLGMDIFNKQSFINQLTLPTRNLRGLEVLETVYSDGKITELRFRIRPQNEIKK